MDVAALQRRLSDFARARDWDQFHDPKNLAMALAAEAGELLEVFQWMTAAEASSVRLRPGEFQAAVQEMADIQIYLLRLAHVLNVHLETAVLTKIAENEAKYPVDRAFGRREKYTEL